jgi:hypothetical protein
MPLLYIREAVVACSDIGVAATFHAEAFGMEVVERVAGSILMGAPNASSGRVRLVAAESTSGPVARVWDLGPRLLGIYSHDLDATAAAVSAAGGESGPPVTYPYGTASLSELVARGPDNVWWTVPLAVPGAHRRSDAYAHAPDRLHSELHTAVLVVDDHDAAVAFFAAGGLGTVFDGEMTGPDFETLVGMPRGAALRLAFMGGPDHLPARFEIMSFTGTPTEDRSADPVGIQRLVFVCDDIASTREALVAAGAQELADGGLRGPVGVVLDLVEEG